jgi:Domain of unknown function (DUF4062)
MPNNSSHQPRNVPQVMVSSTYTDVKDHRAALIVAINTHGLHPKGMENDSAKLVDVIESSLQMVRDSAAYILIISQKYGQIPECPRRNPDRLSITELEFDLAVRLERPILLFIMGERHTLLPVDMELDSEKRDKLIAFRERAKRTSQESTVHRVYAEFNGLQEFKDQVHLPLVELERHLESVGDTRAEPSSAAADLSSTPTPEPPTFYAEPDYIGSHKFVGREPQLQELNDWARAADPTNLLLFECIGGNGKSMLTWEWTTNSNYAPALRDWAGRFWYSFYEHGAVMEDFCRRALAYMSRKPLKEFEKIRTPDLAKDLLAHLRVRPWLLILDGLERVLVAYHRIDAAEVPDEEINAPTDKVLNRAPCDTIRDEDGDLLRALAAARPSKILVSSRLTPRVLLNPAFQLIPGARRITLPGLRPADAELLLRSCGVTGDSEAIQEYLTENCDNHPLVIGVLAGLIANYLPDRGNFDAWLAVTGPQGGAQLDLASLDLIQRRNHILRTALEALPEKSRQLLSTLALLSGAVDYVTLAAFNPYLPPEPEEVPVPRPPEKRLDWTRKSEEQKARAKELYEAALSRHGEYGQALKTWRESVEVYEAPGRLSVTVVDLEQRGLLQYDGRTRRHDLHPVVRSVTASGMKTEERERYGQRVVDHFSSVPHNPYKEAKTLEQLAPGLHVVRTLLKLGRFQEAASAYRGDFSNALLFSLEANVEGLSLLRPFFPSGWSELPKGMDASSAGYLTNDIAIILANCRESSAALDAWSTAIRLRLAQEDWWNLNSKLWNLSRRIFSRENLLAHSFRVNSLSLELADLRDDETNLFLSRLFLFVDQSRLGQWEEAEQTRRQLDRTRLPSDRSLYRQGEAEELFARAQFWKGILQEQLITAAASLAEKDNNRTTLRALHQLRGSWRMEQEEWDQAAASFHEVVRMARERRLTDETSEAGLALAKLHLGQLRQPDEARQEAERLARQRTPHHRYLAMLWYALGDQRQAERHALLAYEWAWGQGEPYVHRYELAKTNELLRELNVLIPVLPPYDPAKDEPFPWEAGVRAAIDQLRDKKGE